MNELLTDEIKNKIVELRYEDKSYDSIANQLNITKRQVRRLCEKVNLSGCRARSENIPFEERFNAKYKGKFEYIAGYDGCDSTVIVRCLKCGTLADKCAQGARKKTGDMKCYTCIANNTAKKKEEKREAYMRLQEERKRVKLEREQTKDRLMNKICRECNEPFKANHLKRIYCSMDCSKRVNSRMNETRRRRKLKENGEVDHSISLTKLIVNDGGVCKLCGDVVVIDEDTNSDHYPSIDHIIPVSKGGTHTWDNVQLAHRICNSLKGDG